MNNDFVYCRNLHWNLAFLNELATLWWVIYGLQGYIQDARFSPSDWLAPGRPLDLQKTKDAKTRLLAPKRIADVVEALIGNAKDANFM